MATKTVAQLTAVISANNTKFKKGIGGAKTSLGGFQKSVAKIGPMIAAAFSINAVKNFAKTSLRVYDQQLKAEQSLLTALDGRVIAQQKLMRQARELQKITLFGDEETIAAQSMVAAFVSSEEQIRILIPLIQDFATAKQMSLVTAADLVTKTFASSTNALSRYGLTVEGTALSAERLKDITDALSSSFEGQAEAAAQADKIFTQLSNTYGDFQENLASYLSQTGGYNIFNVIKEDLQKISEWLDKNTSPALKAAMKDAEGFMDSISGQKAYQQLDAINKKIEDQEGIISRLRGVYKDNVKYADKARGKAKRQYEALMLEEEEKIRVALAYIDILNKEKSVLTEFYVEVDKGTTKQLAYTDALDKTTESSIDLLNVWDELTSTAMLMNNEEFLPDDAGMKLARDNFKGLAKDGKDMSDTLTVAFSQIGSSFAQSMGEVAAGTKTLEESLQEISSLILGALGDILIMAGMKAMADPAVGVPLVLAGLAFKGIGAAVGSADFGGNSQQARLSGAYVNPNKNVLYGNDIRTSGDYYTDVYNKVG